MSSANLFRFTSARDFIRMSDSSPFYCWFFLELIEVDFSINDYSGAVLVPSNWFAALVPSNWFAAPKSIESVLTLLPRNIDVNPREALSDSDSS